MNFKTIEESFNQAVLHSFSRQKLLCVFPALLLCAVLIIFCQALSFGASNWITMSMIFLPIFISSGLLLSVGVLLIRVYYHERKQLTWNFRTIFAKSWRLIIGTSYLSVPTVLIYLFLWVILGIFILLQEIPYIGPTIGVVLSFAPFMIILLSILLVFLNLGILFFVTPAIALRSQGDLHFAKDLLSLLKENIFSLLVFFTIALFPLIVVIAILSVALVATNLNYLISEQGLTLTLQWFFIAIPFTICVTPAVVFFFNFSAETFNLLYTKKGTRP